MSNRWIRLWSDLPTDPKFRTVARISKQPTANVIAVYIHMLVCASSDADFNVTQCDGNVTQGDAKKRGCIVSWRDEDVASALDLETEDVIAIREAMQGRLLEDNFLTGWKKRQPLREDSSKERTKKWRDNKKNNNVTQGDIKVTQGDAPDKDQDKDQDKDEDKELKDNNYLVEQARPVESEKQADQEFVKCSEPKKPKPPDSVQEIFEHWKIQLEHPGAVLDEKRKRLILAALKMGYTPDKLCEAITGCSKTPHNMGQNDRGERYDGLNVIFKDADQIDRFIRNASNPPTQKQRGEFKNESSGRSHQKSKTQMLYDECAPDAFKGTIYEDLYPDKS